VFTKKRIMAAVLALGSIAGAAGAAKADIRDYYIANTNSSASIVGAWYAHPGDPYWHPIQLSSPVEPQSKSRISVDMPYDTSCTFDIKVRFDDNNVETGRFNLCRIGVVVAS
jgi:hypothetical protein